MIINRKQVVIDAINHKETKYCPYVFGWDLFSDIPERLDAYYASNIWRTSFRNYIHRCDAVNDGRNAYYEGPVLRKDNFGSLWRMDMRPFHMDKPVLQKPSLQGYSFPDVNLFLTDEWTKRVNKQIKEHQDCFIVVYPGFGLFERSWAMRGFANVLMDCAAEPAFYEDLLAAIAEFYDKLIDGLLQFPVDGIYFGDDWGDQRGVMIGSERWRQILKPHYKKLYAKVKTTGKYVLHHTCGSVVDIIPDTIEIGLDVLESIQAEAQGMNPYELKEQFGEQIAFWGGLGSQSIIPHGSPDELRKEIKQLASKMTKGGGYILAGAKDLQPETPTENAAAILESFLEVGEEQSSK